MTTEQTAQQLELAAKILRAGHPWETSHTKERWWLATSADDPGVHVVNNQHIRLALATPPDGRAVHNPDNLDAETVGAGYRLTLPGEKPHGDAERWIREGKIWGKRIVLPAAPYASVVTYRLPLSVPWPEVEKPDPYAEPQTKTVPLGPEDVPPGSVFGKHDRISFTWHQVIGVYKSTIKLPTNTETYAYEQLVDDWLINRSIPLTGKWNPDAWEPCSKEIPA